MAATHVADNNAMHAKPRKSCVLLRTSNGFYVLTDCMQQLLMNIFRTSVVSDVRSSAR
jgi:hypothetical protein